VVHKCQVERILTSCLSNASPVHIVPIGMQYLVCFTLNTCVDYALHVESCMMM
jgi:hypothetical protein